MGPAGANTDGPTLPRLRIKASLIAQVEGEGEICPPLWVFPPWISTNLKKKIGHSDNFTYNVK